jgi:hypothetical protein
MPEYNKDIGQRAVVAASRYIGLTELKSNATWDKVSTPGHDDIADELRAVMLRTGWQLGWPYCAAFCEAVWREAYQGRTELDAVKAMLTPGCLMSWNNALKAGWTSMTPQVGAIGIMRKGDTSMGHAFIVRGVRGSTLLTIEGNTSAAGAVSAEADRNGDGVYAKTRELTFKATSGLHLIGFILPCTN